MNSQETYKLNDTEAKIFLLLIIAVFVLLFWGFSAKEDSDAHYDTLSATYYKSGEEGKRTLEKQAGLDWQTGDYNPQRAITIAKKANETYAQETLQKHNISMESYAQWQSQVITYDDNTHTYTVDDYVNGVVEIKNDEKKSLELKTATEMSSTDKIINSSELQKKYLQKVNHYWNFIRPYAIVFAFDQSTTFNFSTTQGNLCKIICASLFSHNLSIDALNDADYDNWNNLLKTTPLKNEK